MLFRGLIAAFVLALGVGFALGSSGSRGAVPSVSAPLRDLGPAPATVPKSVDAYRGVGAWIDMYDPAELGNPWPVLVEMRARGVRTLYLETASWRVPSALDFKDEQAVDLFLDEAHAVGIKVVAWYLPGFDDLGTDLRRSRAVLDYKTPNGGQKFDGFAIDIESQRIRSIGARNAAMLRYSRALRRYAGPSFALGAITPDLRSTTVSPGLWPGFPYRAAARYYDVFLPMAYSSYRGRGASYVYPYSRSNASTVQALTGRPVHMIGGLTAALSSSDAAAFVRGAQDGGAIGASFYDFATGQDGAWRALNLFR